MSIEDDGERGAVVKDAGSRLWLSDRTWPRAPVPDATVPCPACGAISWDEVKPDDDSRGSRGTPGGGTQPMPFVVCRTCGHEEPIGGLMRFSRPENEDPSEVVRRVEESKRRLRESHRFQLTTVDFPIYAVEDSPATMAGSGTSNSAGSPPPPHAVGRDHR